MGRVKGGSAERAALLGEREGSWEGKSSLGGLVCLSEERGKEKRVGNGGLGQLCFSRMDYQVHSLQVKREYTVDESRAY